MEDFLTLTIPKHNALTLKKALENGMAPFIPDTAGNIDVTPIFNISSGYCLPGLRLIMCQTERKVRSFKSNVVCPISSAITYDFTIKKDEKGVPFNFKDEIGEVHTGYLLFPEQTENMAEFIAIAQDKIVDRHNSNISMCIATDDLVEYLGSYIASCRWGMKLSVDPQIAETFKAKLMTIIYNDLSDNRDKKLPTLSCLFFDAERRSTEIIRTLESSERY